MAISNEVLISPHALGEDPTIGHHSIHWAGKEESLSFSRPEDSVEDIGLNYETSSLPLGCDTLTSL